MEDLPELVVSATASGCIYALVALAYLLILRPTSVINFSVGEWAATGAFIGVAVLTPLAWPVVNRILEINVAVRGEACAGVSPEALMLLMDTLDHMRNNLAAAEADAGEPVDQARVAE